MTKCTTLPIDFTTCKRPLFQADFSGGDITSDGGAVLLREMDSRVESTVSRVLHLSDNRRKKQIRHDCLSLLRQRVYATCMGYEDLNDRYPFSLLRWAFTRQFWEINHIVPRNAAHSYQ